MCVVEIETGVKSSRAFIERVLQLPRIVYQAESMLSDSWSDMNMKWFDIVSSRLRRFLNLSDIRVDLLVIYNLFWEHYIFI